MIESPLLKFLFTILFIISVITTSNLELYKLFFNFILIFILISTYKISFKKFIKKFLTLIPFIIFFSITSFFTKNFLNFTSIISKSILSLLAIIFLIETTNFINLIQSLKILRVPNEILNTINLIYRYFFVLLEEIKRMEIARDLRYFGGYIKRQIKVYSNIIGVLFLRSVEKSERVYNAMKLRGYNGEINYLISYEVKIKEFIFLSLLIFILILIKII